MISYKTFSDYKWVAFSPPALLERWDKVRQQAHTFVARELDESDIIAVTESAWGNSPYAFSVTVWYRKG
jgi:hypothetical protein